MSPFSNLGLLNKFMVMKKYVLQNCVTINGNDSRRFYKILGST